jgi:hypothetical protein
LSNNYVAPSFNNSIYIGATAEYIDEGGEPSILMRSANPGITNKIISIDDGFRISVGTNSVLGVQTDNLTIPNSSRFVGLGSGLTGTGTTFTAGDSLALGGVALAWLVQTNAALTGFSSGSATTGQVATANGSGGTFWATPAAGSSPGQLVWIGDYTNTTPATQINIELGALYSRLEISAYGLAVATNAGSVNASLRCQFNGLTTNYYGTAWGVAVGGWRAAEGIGNAFLTDLPSGMEIIGINRTNSPAYMTAYGNSTFFLRMIQMPSGWKAEREASGFSIANGNSGLGKKGQCIQTNMLTGCSNLLFYVDTGLPLASGAVFRVWGEL